MALSLQAGRRMGKEDFSFKNKKVGVEEQPVLSVGNILSTAQVRDHGGLAHSHRHGNMFSGQCIL